MNVAIMRTTIEKVQLGVGVGAGLLVLIVVGFLGYAHRQAHRLLSDLPARLGAEIQKETNGYTRSESIKGRTVYTIHAAKATQRKDGVTGLRDVSITLYGKKGARTDHLYGKDFEYDARNGVIRAVGEVQLDLQAPGTSGPHQAVQSGIASGEPIHVTTSGLVYLQRLGLASTDRPIHFEYSGITGEAEGATYNGDSGTTILERNVRLSGLHEGRPTVLTASHAEFDRLQHRITLQAARYVVLGGAESERTGESASAGTLVVHLGDSGHIEAADFGNNVELHSESSVIRAPQGTLRFGPGSKPQTAQMTGGVTFSNDGGGGASGESLVAGRADEGTAVFGGSGELETLHLSNGVEATSADTKGAEKRELSGRDVVLRLAAPIKGPRWIEQATISGQARLGSVAPKTAGSTSVKDEVRANTLVVRWVRDGRSNALHDLTGSGQTEVRRSSAGIEQVSRGDQLEANFTRPAAGDRRRTSGAGLSTAIQRGHVILDRIKQSARAGDAPLLTHATAEGASYESSTGHLTLSDHVDVTDAGSELRAERMLLTESSGNAEVTGDVQATYVQASPAQATGDATRNGKETEPVHVVAVRASLNQDVGAVTFFGTKAKAARLWQGASQVEAPTLLLHRQNQTLDAFGDRDDDSMPVRTVLATAPSPTRKPQAKSGTPSAPAVLRIRSGRLHYSNENRQANFTGRVVVEDADGSMTSRDAVATLVQGAEIAHSPRPLPNTGAPAQPSLLGGGLDRIVATGEVLIRQPGRVATGQQAVYTSFDKIFLLTGTRTAPPKITDAGNGDVSGAALRFRSGDNSVVVEGRSEDPSAATTDGRVHTRTRVKQ